jgi:hypothetical protein
MLFCPPYLLANGGQTMKLFAHPCILIPVMVSYHDLRQKQLVPTLKDQPCRVDQAFCLASDANLDTER